MAFDPYHKWLGIRPEQQPPTYFQMLSISPDEQDPEVIEEAAIRQTAHVRSYQIGPHGAMATRLLNEISQARTVLLNPTKRKDYEAKLTRSALPKAAPGASDTQAARQFADLADTDAPIPAKASANLQKGKDSGKKPPVVALVAGGIALLVVVIGLVVLIPRGERTPTGDKISQTDSPPKKKVVPGDKTKIDDSQVKPPSKEKDKDKDKDVPPPGDKTIKPSDKKDPIKEVVEKAMGLAEDLVFKLTGHKGEVWSVAFSGDGKRLISGANDGEAIVWDLATKEPLFKLPKHKQGVSEAVLSPDGRTAATGSRDQTARVWDLSGPNPRERAVIDKHESGSTSSLAMSPDGKTLALSGQFGEIRRFDLNADIPEEREKLKGQTRAANLQFSRDGNMLAATSDEHTLYWDHVKSAAAPKAVKVGNGSMAVALNSNGQKLVVGTNKGFVELWDLSENEPRQISSAKGHSQLTSCCFFAPDDKSFFSTGGGYNPSGEHLAVQWDAATGAKLKAWRLPERSAAGAISPDGALLAVACHDRQVYFLKLRATSDPIVTGPEASGPSPLDKLEPEKIAVEDRVQKIPELVAVLKGPKSAIFGIAFSPDSKKLACACDEGQLYFWDLSDGKAAEGLPLGPMGGALNGVAFSADGKKLVCAHQGLVRIYDVTGPEPKGIREIPVKVAQYPWVAWSPDGTTLALNDHDGGVRLLDWVQDKEGPILRGHAGQAKTVYFSRDGKSLLSAGVEGKDGRVIVWDMTKNPPAPKDNSSFGGQQLWHAVFSPDEKKVAFGANDGSVRMLSYPKLTTLWSKKEHRQFANSVCFAPDGKTLISTEGGYNSQGPHYLIWWNAANGDVIKKWELPERCSQGVFAPSGLYVALTNHNSKVYILRLKAE